MNQVLDQLKNSTLSKIKSGITNRISAECRETLKLVKSITSQYRHTNKQPPTKPSYFIPNVFKPIHQFNEQNQGWTDTATQLEWADIVCKSIITEYTTIVNDLLDSMIKTEESLKKLKNKKSNATEDSMSDEDKIRLQLFLDVEQLGQEVIKAALIIILFSTHY